ncbi:hypothetical protein FRC08_003014 [Ceratobasidium sp. 394]|nr:hypothetical protein FRC08_003014 [Ceratobasidium sp. 394]KAG9088483.1 hypothetical protein FS749_002133 [Ceratobasidium sp. UAMH 11750]
MAPKRVHCSIDSAETPLVEIKFYDDEDVKPQGSRRKKGRTKPAPTKLSFTVADSSLSRDSHTLSHPNNPSAQANVNVGQGEPSTLEPPAQAENGPVLHDESDGIAQGLENDSTQPEITSKKMTTATFTFTQVIIVRRLLNLLLAASAFRSSTCYISARFASVPLTFAAPACLIPIACYRHTVPKSGMGPYGATAAWLAWVSLCISGTTDNLAIKTNPTVLS